MEPGKKVLIIEDEPTLANICKTHLEREGYSVELAFDGDEGLAKIRSSPPDVILLDIVMPKRDGVTLLREIRKNSSKRIPVIVLSNLSSQKSMEDAKNAGSDEYLVKAQHTLDDIVKSVRKF